MAAVLPGSCGPTAITASLGLCARSGEACRGLGEELTPTRKPGRQPIAAKYAVIFDSLYYGTTEPERGKARPVIGSQAP